jgi:signal peptidase II
MSIAILLFYIFLEKKIGSNKFIDIMFAFIFSGAMCSLIDKVFWNGSLDYIFLSGFFTFDLKDVYINVFIGLLILMIITKNETLKKFDDTNILKDFLRFMTRMKV